MWYGEPSASLDYRVPYNPSIFTEAGVSQLVTPAASTG